MSDTLKQHIENVLEDNFAVMNGTRRRTEELESQGHRIVTGGPVGEDGWDIIDWRTNEILAAGDGGLDEYEAAGKRLDPENNWVHRDAILEEEDDSRVQTDGLPEGLAAAVEDWVLDGDPEEIAEYIGWPVGKVEEYQAEA
ncbi:hypothetical protein [Actinoplanes solisilvae]|uniref:hypothetical protein n=1 Tax=Actinoplanes solisilvae TaxID=2486853 RepID=UPI000FDA0F08|nr:hypothetical protein [Actinoplanes solisilvae]